MKFKVSKVFITIVVLALVASAGVYIWQDLAIPKEKISIVLKVEERESVQDIVQKLKDQGILQKKVYFYFTQFIFGNGKPIQPGGYKLSNQMTVREMVRALEGESWSKLVTLPPDLSKEEISDIVSDALGWELLDRQFFPNTYAGMQWQKYDEAIDKMIEEEFEGDKTKVQAFLTLSSLYHDPEYDFFKNMYIPGTYEIPREYSRAQVGGIFIDEFEKKYPDEEVALKQFINNEALQSVTKLIDTEMVLMPDIVAVPPTDVTYKNIDGRSYVLFTTSYWNKGRGPLELLADPRTKDITGDINRDVYQRIYRLDGNYSEKLSGNFLWHKPHLHYHFTDFAVYTLEPVELDDPKVKFTEKYSYKSTFCVRDSEPIDLSHPGSSKEPSFRICGRERQGISSGWADSYYYTYVDQKFDITDAPKGLYKLSIIINPKNRFQEITTNNNVGEVLLAIDVKNKKIEVIEKNQHGI